MDATSEGTLVCVMDRPNGTGGGNIGVNWNQAEKIYITSSGLQCDVLTSGNGFDDFINTNAAFIPWSPSNTARFVILTWKSNGDNTTTIKAYDYTGLETMTQTVNGLINTGENINWVECNFFEDNSSQDVAVYSYAFTAAQASSMASSLSQNDSNYVDPTPGCTQPAAAQAQTQVYTRGWL